MSKKTPAPPPTVGKSEAARIVGVTLPCVNNWLRAGTFPQADYVMPSGRQRWLVSTVNAWLESRRTAQGGAV